MMDVGLSGSIYVSLFVWIFSGIIAVDAFIVIVLKQQSLSAQTWIVEQTHPLIRVVIVLGTCYVCYLVRSSPLEVGLMAAAGCHLAGSEQSGA